jgi:signal transduction histidine kinase/ligand-binding sensor domain-containing protein
MFSGRLLLALLLLLGWDAGLAAGAADWQALSDPVFQRADLPVPVYHTAMVQDDQGFLWLGTQNGLFRWDGYGLRSIPVNPSQRGALPDGFINVLHKDRRGRLWVGTAAGGLARLDPATGEVSLAEMGPSGLSHVSVLSMCDDGQGRLWVGTAAGLDHVDPDALAVDRHATQARAQGLPEARVNAVIQDGDGGLWAGTSVGLFVLKPQAKAFVRVPLPGPGDDAPSVMSLMIDAAQRVWVGTRVRGVYTVARGSLSAEPLRATEADDVRLSSDLVKAMLDLGDGRVWVGTAGGGLVEVDIRAWTTRRIRHYKEVEASLPAGEVDTLLRDASGRIWVGTGVTLSSHDPMQRGIITWFGVTGRERHLAHPNPDVILPMPDGTVWLGVGEGVEIVDPVRGRIGQLESDPAKPQTALPKAHILSMARAEDGAAYIGTPQGLYRADMQQRTVRRVEVAGRKPTATASALCATGDRLWVGDIDGLWEIRLGPAGPIEVLSHEPLVLGRSHVTSIACSDPNTLWVGTRAGLARYDRTQRHIDWPETDAPGQLGMPRGFITSVRTDPRGRLWVSSYGGGLRVLEAGNTGRAGLRRIGASEGLSLNAANALLIDARGDAWVSTDDGLAHIASDTLAVTMLRGAEGVGIRSYWTNAAALTASGDLLFGGVGGFTVVRPQDMGPGRGGRGAASAGFKPPVILTTGEDLLVPGAGITLKPSQRALQVTFSVLDYAAPERSRYAYRLQGLEQGWTESSPESRTARYTNLPPGDYVLEVKAAGHTGDWVQGYWPLHVEPAWHETGWARAALVMLALALASFLVHLRTRLLKSRALALEALVARRTGELEHRTQQLEASREALRELGAHNTRLLEDERKRVARELHDELGQQLAALKMEVGVLKARSNAGAVPEPEQWDELRGRVEGLVSSMRGLVADLRPVALDAGVGPALEWLASEFTRHTGIPCKVEADPACRELPPDVAIVVFRIAQEALNNVRRHARAHRAAVTLRPLAGRWQLCISDDGQGFDIAQRRGGYGLLGMEERAGLIGGALEIASKPGGGTLVRLTLGGTARSEAPVAPSQAAV